MGGLRHKFDCALSDDPDDTLIQVSDWNDEHVLLMIAADAISGHMAISADANGDAAYTSADDLLLLRTFKGISLNAAILDGTVQVQNCGIITHAGWSWTPNGLIYVGMDGALVQTPEPSSEALLVVGIALSATTISIQIQPLIVLV